MTEIRLHISCYSVILLTSACAFGFGCFASHNTSRSKITARCPLLYIVNVSVVRLFIDFVFCCCLSHPFIESLHRGKSMENLRIKIIYTGVIFILFFLLVSDTRYQLWSSVEVWANQFFVLGGIGTSIWNLWNNTRWFEAQSRCQHQWDIAISVSDVPRNMSRCDQQYVFRGYLHHRLTGLNTQYFAIRTTGGFICKFLSRELTAFIMVFSTSLLVASITLLDDYKIFLTWNLMLGFTSGAAIR